ncbi:hypothetical protein [Rhodothalassium salexigens]|uniref:hypothetical protein n=1 Tax=Rhodothalassium salexigens TaxID=1086 RepID=UPI001912A584|nr:hypothetical protein [Rhodothalassium salexigens]
MLRFLLHHCLVGIAVGWTFMAALLALDIGALRTLIWQSDVTVLALGLLAFFLAITFGSLAMGTAVMSQDGEGRTPPGRRRGLSLGLAFRPAPMPVPVPVRARQRPRR